ncbi:MAG: hypothetical protein RL277_2364, partial [Planctomycetota bacterium]
ALPLPSNISLDETPDYLTWKTPGGNTIRMPYRESTLEHHSKRLGTAGAKKYLSQVATGVGEGADEKIREYQESFFNQHPHIRQALIGGGTGALVGALVMAHAPSLRPKHLALGLLGGAGIGALLGQLGDTSIRKGPETMEFLPEDSASGSPVSPFYHESPTERRNRQHMDEVEDFNNYQLGRNVYKDLDRSYYHHGKYGSESGAWQRAEGKNPEGGLNAKGRASLKAQGHDIKPGVKGKADTPEKKRRKGSFLSRMFGPGAPGSMKKDNGEPSRRALSAKAWGEPVPQNDADRARLYAKGQALLESYDRSKKAALNLEKLALTANQTRALGGLAGALGSGALAYGASDSPDAGRNALLAAVAGGAAGAGAGHLHHQAQRQQTINRAATGAGLLGALGLGHHLYQRHQEGRAAPRPSSHAAPSAAHEGTPHAAPSAAHEGRPTKPGPRPDRLKYVYRDGTIRDPNDVYEKNVHDNWEDRPNRHRLRLESRERRSLKDFREGLIDEGEYLRQKQENHAIYENHLTDEDRALALKRKQTFLEEPRQFRSREENEAQLQLEHAANPYRPAAIHYLRQIRQEEELKYLIAHGLPTDDNLREARQNYLEYLAALKSSNQKISHVKLASAHYAAAQKVFARYGLLHLL